MDYLDYFLQSVNSIKKVSFEMVLLCIEDHKKFPHYTISLNASYNNYIWQDVSYMCFYLPIYVLSDASTYDPMSP